MTDKDRSDSRSTLLYTLVYALGIVVGAYLKRYALIIISRLSRKLRKQPFSFFFIPSYPACVIRGNKVDQQGPGS